MCCYFISPQDESGCLAAECFWCFDPARTPEQWCDSLCPPGTGTRSDYNDADVFIRDLVRFPEDDAQVKELWSDVPPCVAGTVYGIEAMYAVENV